MRTAFEKIPAGWTKATIGDIARVTAGSAFPLRYQGKKSGELPFAKVSDMNLKGNEKYLTRAVNYLDREDLKTVKAKALPAGTVIFPKVGAALLTNKRRILQTDTIVDNNIMGLIPQGVSSEFFYYWMLNFDVTSHIGNGALPSINQGYVEKLELLLPTMREQERIVQILSTVDIEIQKTSEVLGGLYLLKKGLMQDLFTRGISNKKFKETKIGTIPETWELNILENFCTLQRGFDLPVQKRSHGSVPIIASNGVIGVHSEAVVKGPGVITGRSGTIGKVLYVEEDFWPLNTTLYVKDFHGNDPKYVYYRLQSFKLENFSTGTGVPTLNRNIVHRESIAVPSITEQKKIAEILSAVDTQIDIGSNLRLKLTAIKKGLMQDLLSGIKRVNI